MTIENRETSLKVNYKVYCAVTAILGANASVAPQRHPRMRHRPGRTREVSQSAK